MSIMREFGIYGPEPDANSPKRRNIRLAVGLDVEAQEPHLGSAGVAKSTGFLRVRAARRLRRRK
ncbi:hypothetical protein Lfu02_17570 [Longispora fulva]|nr:hypothetical protein Lfu02_17570 [Longispora fulva]